MASGEANYKVGLKTDKFNGEGWYMWRHKMEMVLVSSDLWDIVTGEEPIPENEEQGGSTISKWKKRDRKAQAEISLHLSDSQLPLVMRLKTSKDMWDALKNQYERKSMQNVIFFKRKYRDAKMKEGEDMLKHINKHQEIVDQLVAVGAEISEQEQVWELLLSLPESYDNLVNALEFSDDLTLPVLRQRLLLEEQKRKQRAMEGRSEEALASSKDPSRNNNFSRVRQKGPNRTANRIPNRSAIQCYNCGKYGHIAKECHGTKRKQSANSAISQSANQAFIVQTCVTRSEEKCKREWFIDSGASQHMCCVREYFQGYKELASPEKVRLANDTMISGVGIGSVIWEDKELNETTTIKNVLFVPELSQNLISVKKITQAGYKVEFSGTTCKVKSKDLQHIIVKGRIYPGGNLYQLDGDVISNCAQASITKNESNLSLWNRRLGHINKESLINMQSKEMVKGLAIKGTDNEVACEGCLLGKQCRESFPKRSESRATDVLEIIHSDVCGPMENVSIGGSRYFLTFTDDFSRYTFAYFLKNKSEVPQYFKEFVTMAEKQTGKSVKVLRSDNGTEYTNNAMSSFLKDKGIVRQLTAPYTPQQNGVSERKNRTIVESARCMLHYAGLSYKFWAEAVNNAVYVLNATSTTSLNGKVPFEVFYGKKPSVSHYRTFGCDCYAFISKEKRTKWAPKSCKCYFLGYSSQTKGYRLFEPKTGKVIVSRDVKFNENSFSDRVQHGHEIELEIEQEVPKDTAEKDVQKEKETTNETEQEEPIVEVVNERQQEVNENQEQDIRKSSRVRQQPERYGEWLEDDVLNEILYANSANTTEPTTYKEAVESPENEKWKTAMQSEYDSLMKNETWKLVKLPENRDAIGSKWVFKIKRNADGSIDRYKARLVAQGYSQKEGIDFEETFSPVARFTSIRTILALANELNLEVHQMDVQTAFLHGKLSEEIYMEQPRGFEKAGSENLVCKLEKGLYGLKQASRCWFLTIDEFLQDNSYKQCDGDRCVYLKAVGDKFLILALYVDDVILATNSLQLLKSEKEKLMKRFAMKDLGEAKFCLGIQIIRKRKEGKMLLLQKSYLENLLVKFGMQDSKPISTPQDLGMKLSKNEGEPIDIKRYQAAIGGLTYAVCATRPDLAAALSSLNQYSSNPSQEHWKAVKRVLRYIKGTLDYGLLYQSSQNGNVQLKGYVDADWGGAETRKSISGYLFSLGNNLVSWASKRQATTALSTTEAEYVAASSAGQEAVWLRLLLQSLGFEQKKATVIQEDNQGCIALSKNPKFHARTKHIDIKHHYIRDLVTTNQIDLSYCASHKMVADVLTKPLPKEQFERFRNRMQVKNEV